MSKTEFARRVGISTTTVYRWLYGESFESSYLENVAKVMSGVYGFRISAEDLLNRDYILDEGEGYEEGVEEELQKLSPDHRAAIEDMKLFDKRQIIRLRLFIEDMLGEEGRRDRESRERGDNSAG